MFFFSKPFCKALSIVLTVSLIEISVFSPLSIALRVFLIKVLRLLRLDLLRSEIFLFWRRDLAACLVWGIRILNDIRDKGGRRAKREI